MATNEEILDKAEWRVGYTGMWKWLNRGDIERLLELARLDERAKVAEEVFRELEKFEYKRHAYFEGESYRAFEIGGYLDLKEKYLGKKPEGKKEGE